MQKLIKLYITFFKIGITTFGGGLAMLPILEEKLVNQLKWITKEELVDYYAIGQCTPGIIAVNVSTFVGNKLKGIIGALFSTLGMISPSIIIILLIAYFLEPFMGSSLIISAFKGIKVGVCAVVTLSLVNLYKKNIKTKIDIILCISSFILITFTKITPVTIIIVIFIYTLIYLIRGKIKCNN